MNFLQPNGPREFRRCAGYTVGAERKMTAMINLSTLGDRTDDLPCEGGPAAAPTTMTALAAAEAEKLRIRAAREALGAP